MLKYAPYSHSKLACYAGCPRKFKYVYVDKVPRSREDNVYLEKGKYYHSFLEKHPVRPVKFNFKFADGKQVMEYDEVLREALADPTVYEILNGSLKREFKFNLSEEFSYMRTKTGAAFTGYIDVLAKVGGRITVADWKTGKTKVGPDQLELYTVWAFSAMPKVDTVVAKYVYLDLREESVHEFRRDRDYEKLKSSLINKVKSIEGDAEFCKNANRWCDRCEYFNACSPFKTKRKE